MNKYINEIIITSGYHGEMKDYPKPLRQEQWVKSYVRICGLKRSESKEYQESLSKVKEHEKSFVVGMDLSVYREIDERLRQEYKKIDDQIGESTQKDMDEIVEHLKENRRKLKESEGSA